MFDKDGNGYVSANEIKYVRNYLDMELTDEDIDEMVVEADTNNDAQVGLIEFYLLFLCFLGGF